MVNPTDEEISGLDNQLGLDENLVRDALDPFEVPRLETEEKEVYFFTRFVEQSGTTSTYIPILFIIDENCLVTVSTKEFPLFEKLTRKLEAEGTEDKIVVFGRMLFLILREYHKLILSLSRQIQAANASLGSIQNAQIVELVNFENTFHDILSSLVPTHIAVGQLLTGKFIHLDEDDEEILLDVQLYINQMIEMSKSNIERVVNIREATDSILSSKLNTTMRFLAGMTLIFTIPTMIFSFFGMNVALPLQEQALAHGIILGGAGVISLCLLVLFIRKQLL